MTKKFQIYDPKTVFIHYMFDKILTGLIRNTMNKKLSQKMEEEVVVKWHNLYTANRLKDISIGKILFN